MPRRRRKAAKSQPCTVGLISLGCAKNRVDSEIMLQSVMEAGMSLAPSVEQADVILINTCAFIADAKRESLDAILAAVERKNRGLCRAIAVAGCLPQRYQRSLQSELPEIDAFVGLDQARRMGSILARAAAGNARQYQVAAQPRAVLNPKPNRPLLSAGPYAYIRLADGCNHFCAYCAIPLIRGRLRSRKPEAVISECEGLLSRGIRELNLISQDVLDYGVDLAGRRLLPDLLRRLDRLGGKFWIRLLYGHPESLDAALLDAMAESANVCRYLDLPIQHAHPAVLRAMGRNGSAPALRKLFENTRQRLPGIALRTTCLVGFPGETEVRFKTLLGLVRDVKFDHLGVFAYSREEGTRAAGMPKQVSAATAKERRSALLAAQRNVVDAHAAALKGVEVEALLEQPAKTGRAWLARTAGQAPEADGATRITGLPAASSAGDFVRARIIGQAGCNLVAAAVRTRV